MVKTDEDYIYERKKYLEAILDSKAEKKLIIAGPGTGKTNTFKQVLETTFCLSKKKGLVITFIRNLVKDLEKDLRHLADVKTFHSFCRSEIKRIKGRDFEYYPNLLEIIKEDLLILKPSPRIGKKALDNYFYELNENIIKEAIRIADYYNAGGHTDSVYRVYDHYQSNDKIIPKYSIVLVDEYQDFNLLETKLVEMLAMKSPILIVGDDDQALYTFKDSNPKFIRELAKNRCYKRYELPYCSRCTKVIVDAINEIVSISKKNNWLVNRIDKKFLYFPPEKEKDSEENPLLVDIQCSVERKDCLYAAKFIIHEIFKMHDEYKKEALERSEPAALIIGPGQFLKSIKSYMENMNTELLKNGWTYIAKKEEINKPRVIDAYKLLLNNPNSKLGWRIVLGQKNDKNTKNIIKGAIEGNKLITSLINGNVYNEYKKIIDILKKLYKQNPIQGAEIRFIEEKIKIPLKKIRESFIDEEEDGDSEEEKSDKPRILCTSFEGSKGLSAQYVFIVGFNAGHFPRRNPPTDLDICRLIVALTRARKKVYLISYGNLGGQFLKDSIFKSYLKKYLSNKTLVNKNYIKRLS